MTLISLSFYAVFVMGICGEVYLPCSSGNGVCVLSKRKLHISVSGMFIAISNSSFDITGYTCVVK